MEHRFDHVLPNPNTIPHHLIHCAISSYASCLLKIKVIDLSCLTTTTSAPKKTIINACQTKLKTNMLIPLLKLPGWYIFWKTVNLCTSRAPFNKMQSTLGGMALFIPLFGIEKIPRYPVFHSFLAVN